MFRLFWESAGFSEIWPNSENTEQPTLNAAPERGSMSRSNARRTGRTRLIHTLLLATLLRVADRAPGNALLCLAPLLRGVKQARNL
jgi:hypothetical protein